MTTTQARLIAPSKTVVMMIELFNRRHKRYVLDRVVVGDTISTCHLQFFTTTGKTVRQATEVDCRGRVKYLIASTAQDGENESQQN